MSLETALARVAELNTLLTPSQPPPPAAQPSTSFQQQLQGAMAPAGATGGAAAPAAAAPSQAAPGSYPHLSGDLDADPELLRRLEALAAQRGERFHINSGLRTHAEQQRLWDNRHSNPNPVAPPGRSNHHSGRAADVSIGGRPIQSVISAAELRAAGLNPLAGDPPHVDLA